MTTAFTICANNYLAHAKTLALSFKENHPEVHFVIAILDEPEQSLDYSILGADEVTWVSKIFPELINQVKDTYSIAELCTVVKPALCLYFFNKGNISLFYIDPDIKVFSPFDEVFENLKKADMVLTPHICSPTPEKGHPQDKDLMRTGIYNLGFIAMNNTPEVKLFVEWWDNRVKKYGFHDLKKGYFYDQIWLGYAPAFLDKVSVLRHLGYNVANWNLHERKVIKTDQGYFINDIKTPLRFFHFSHFKMEALPQIASYNQNFNLENRPDIVPVYYDYKSNLEKHGYNRLKTIDYVYGKKTLQNQSKSLKSNQKSRFFRFWELLKKSVRTLIRG